MEAARKSDISKAFGISKLARPGWRESDIPTLRSEERSGGDSPNATHKPLLGVSSAGPADVGDADD